MNILFPYMARWKAINWSRYHQILTKLAQMGHQVHVFQPPSQQSNETNYQEIEVAIPANFHLHEIALNEFIWQTHFPLNKLIKKGYYSLAVVSEIRKFIRQNRIDVMLLYNIPQYPLLRIKECPIVFDFADDYIDMLRYEIGSLQKLQILRLAKYLLDQMFKRSDMTLAVSNVLLEKLNYPSRLLPNGVDLSEFTIGSGQDLSKNYTRPIIGFIGSFEYFIDFDLILSAAKRLPEMTFLMVGSGRETPKIQERIERDSLRNIVLTGGKPHYEIGKYIDIMDVCLNIFKKIPVSHRACPIKLFEYLAMKKPVISTRLDEVQKIDTGYLWYADTVEELVNTVRQIVDNADTTQKFIQKGFESVQNQYNWEVIARDFVSIVEEISQKKVA
ncbi:glycosyltransferase family 4 protein [candidate division KSB1 bacterium]|nr:glycosyltransferase family 4 protein [candidate division KSB1 bacterium]